MADLRYHMCPLCNVNPIQVKYDDGNKKQYIRCGKCEQIVWIRVLKNKITMGWHIKDQND